MLVPCKCGAQFDCYHPLQLYCAVCRLAMTRLRKRDCERRRRKRYWRPKNRPVSDAALDLRALERPLKRPRYGTRTPILTPDCRAWAEIRYIHLELGGPTGYPSSMHPWNWRYFAESEKSA